MSTFTAECSAPPAFAWALYARPQEWSQWAPHVRGAWGLSGPDGEVLEGAHGAARLLGALPVPARVTHVERGRAWTWRVGPIEMTHRVEPHAGDGGCTVALELRAPAPLGAAASAAYGPVVRIMLRRLAAKAQQRARAAT